MRARLKAMLLYPLPHHALSRIVFWLTRINTPMAQPLMRWFSRCYGANMQEAKASQFSAYPNFNAFFTRALHPAARPIADSPNALACPVDGTVSQAGAIRDGQVLQAKGYHYSLQALLGGDQHDALPFGDGKFATLYLAPGDYHRIHTPLAAILSQMIYVPGRLFSVAPHTVDNVAGLFTRNERVVALFDTAAGKMALVLVGAINVAAIETVWAGLVTPPNGTTIKRNNYPAEQAPSFQKGDEVGRFNMGSTVILLTESTVQLGDSLQTGHKVRMGQQIASFPLPSPSD